MSEINRRVIERVLTHKQIKNIIKNLQKTMLYDKSLPINIKYSENVNPEIDYDVVEAVLEDIIDKSLKLKDRFTKDKLNEKESK